MGVKTPLRLEEANRLFEGQRFSALHATQDGIIDTTYIAETPRGRCILKRYEEAMPEAVAAEELLLQHLRRRGLNVPEPLGGSGRWRLFGCLEGSSPKRVTLRHIGAVAVFLGRMHRETRGLCTVPAAFERSDVKRALSRIRRHSPAAWHRFAPLAESGLFSQCDGVIHGDLFPDNCVFEGGRIGVFDFIEAGFGSFLLDAAVVAANWALRGKDAGRVRHFVQVYNRHAPRKIAFAELCDAMETASRLYAMKRYVHTQIEGDGAPPYRQQLEKLRQIKQLKARERLFCPERGKLQCHSGQRSFRGLASEAVKKGIL